MIILRNLLFCFEYDRKFKSIEVFFVVMLDVVEWEEFGVEKVGCEVCRENVFRFLECLNLLSEWVFIKLGLDWIGLDW